MSKDFVYVDSKDLIEEFYKHAKSKTIIGIDLEAENNYHHYGYYVSLIQISAGDKAFIIDAIKLSAKDLIPVLKILTDENIEKVFHDINFDFRILNYQYKTLPKNIFDTKIAAELLNEEKVGLKDLLYKYFNVIKQKKFQKADWSKRPLDRELLEYAAGDVKFLVALRNLLKKQLIEKKLWEKAKEKFAQAEKKDYFLKKQSYLDVRGVGNLSESELSFFKDLFELRDKLARKVNRPPFYIISNKKMLEIVKNPPKNLSEWQIMKGVHPIVRKKAYYFHKLSIKPRGKSNRE